MSGAFDVGAFDSVAFDTGEVVTPGGLYYPFLYTQPMPYRMPDDEEALIAWFALEEM